MRDTQDYIPTTQVKGRPLVTEEERATMPPEQLQRLAYCRWMEHRKTGRIAALDPPASTDAHRK